MLTGMLAYTHMAPTEYDGEPYFALSLGAEITSLIGIATALWVIAYLTWIFWQIRGDRLDAANQTAGVSVHLGEWWVVLAHAVAFGSGYVLGAWNVSFLLVLAVHHEVQYLYFTYAMARHAAGSHAVSKAVIDVANHDGRALRTEAGHAASFLLWPVIGFAAAIAGGWSQLEWLAPLGMGGLFCHYWLDGRIWTRRSFELT
jgi:hypothetical protein